LSPRLLNKGEGPEEEEEEEEAETVEEVQDDPAVVEGREDEFPPLLLSDSVGEVSSEESEVLGSVELLPFVEFSWLEESWSLDKCRVLGEAARSFSRVRVKGRAVPGAFKLVRGVRGKTALIDRVGAEEV
jgi:hypothetical protein